MNGIHEVTGSTPVWSTISFRFAQSMAAHPVVRQGASPSVRLTGSTPVWSTKPSFPASVSRK